MKKFLLFAFLFVFSSCQDEENIPTLSNDQTAQQLDKGDKVVVCHKTGKGTVIALEISINALPAHLAHGDYLPDADGDGYTAVGACTGSMNDCNDNDPAINPGVAEVCDGIDNNCNGQIDEGFDLDGDGFTTCAGDCDDNDNTIYPNATEVCSDNIDNNCDGEIDEDCEPQPCPGIPTINYEGKTYNTVQIGTQCWLRENLDIGTMIPGNQYPSNNGTIEKHCYNNLTTNCDFYGALYRWDEAMQYTTTEGTRGICPEGWHIPTNSEYQVLVNFAGDGNSLKAVGQGVGGGAGTNSSGFTGLLAGCLDYSRFNGINWGGDFWTSTLYEYNNTRARYLYLSPDLNFYSLDHWMRSSGFSVRCLKD